MHKESHQYIDIVSMFKPVTKWNARLTSSAIIPEVVRKAFKVAQAQKPGPTHIELPEDVMAATIDAEPLPARTTLRRPEPSAQELLKAADVIRGAISPVVLAGNGVARTRLGRRRCASSPAPPGSAWPRRSWARGCSPTTTRATWARSACSRATTAWPASRTPTSSSRSATTSSSTRRSTGTRRATRRSCCVDTVAPEVDAHYITEVDLVGDLYHILSRLAEELRTDPHPTPHSRLNDIVLGRFEAAKDDDQFPMQPPRALWDIRQALRPQDILISDVGLHKLWIARMFPAQEPNTVFIANGLAGMGIALPTAIAAKLVHPERNVVTVNGDGGFLMNVQELETAVRLRTPIVNVIWENRQYGSIVWKQDKKFGRHFGTDFTNPDFVKLADAFGMPAWRCESTEDFGRHLRHALTLDLPSLIVLPIDYSIDVAISEELGTETVAA